MPNIKCFCWIFSNFWVFHHFGGGGRIWWTKTKSKYSTTYIIYIYIYIYIYICNAGSGTFTFIFCSSNSPSTPKMMKYPKITYVHKLKLKMTTKLEFYANRNTVKQWKLRNIKKLIFFGRLISCWFSITAS